MAGCTVKCVNYFRQSYYNMLISLCGGRNDAMIAIFKKPPNCNLYDYVNKKYIRFIGAMDAYGICFVVYEDGLMENVFCPSFAYVNHIDEALKSTFRLREPHR